MTANGCQQCGENTYSGAGASSCTSCPDGKRSAAGSTSVADCSYGKTDDFFLKEGFTSHIKTLAAVFIPRSYVITFFHCILW